MSEKEDWRRPSGTEESGSLIIEVDVVTGNVRSRTAGEDDDGLSGDREPRKPKIPPFAGSVAIAVEVPQQAGH